MAIRKRKRRVLPAIQQDRKKYIQALLVLILILIAFVHLRAAFLAQLAMNKSGSMAGFSASLTDPDALTSLARREHLIEGNLPRGFQLYQKALANFVLHVPAWLGLAELYNDMGERDRAVGALRYVQKFAARGAEKSWSMALLANDLDSEDILAANLLWLAVNQPGKRHDVFALADLYWQNPKQLLELFGPALDADILNYYMRVNAVDKAEAVWRKMVDTGPLSGDLILTYVNFLLRHDRVNEAGSIWRAWYLDGDSLLFNPDLRLPFTGSGFGWRIHRPDGVTWEPLSGPKGLKIVFAGTSNPSFTLSQIVPIEPGTYTLTGMVGSDSLTTDQRPYWSVSGYKCPGPALKGDMLPANSPRRRFSLSFTVPEACSAVQLSFRRNTSFFFDNKIAGTITLDSLELTRTSSQQPGEPIQTRLEAVATKKKVRQPDQAPESIDIRIKKMKVQ